tara:strand:+ start:8881 stop:10596 length:1716 start_codon:yes stop_codon:yes gene_type:complete
MEKIICTKKNSTKKKLHLGMWAVDNKELFNKKTEFNTYQYHWDNPKKLDIDYKYLEKFTYKTTKKLAQLLNKVHKKKFSLKYWEFLLFPWVIANNSILYDRWESITTVNIKKKFFYIDSNNFNNSYIQDYNHLINLSQRNDWNEELYFKIIKFNKLKYKLVNKKNLVNKIFYVEKNRFFKRGIFTIIKFFLSIILSFKNHKKKLFLNTQYNFLIFKKYFDTKKIDFGFKYLEKINNFFIDTYEEPEKRLIFTNLTEKNLNYKKGFEKFFWKNISNYLPKTYLENFNFLHSKAIKRKNYDKIYTSFSHFNDLSDKFYIAGHINKKKKIYLFEHGGSLPAFKELFYFEEKLFNCKYTFYNPIKKNQKLIDLNPYYIKFNSSPKEQGKYCCIFCGETPMWNYRVQFYATSSQSLKTYELTSNIIQNLSTKVRDKTLIKIKKISNGFNFKKHYENKFGKKIIYNKMDTKKFILNAKFLILTYPETTLIEAVISKKPFIIVYHKKFYKRHNSVNSVLSKMKECKILFEDPIKAANHLNANWENPNIWFESKKVQLTISLLKKKFFPQKLLEKKIDL